MTNLHCHIVSLFIFCPLFPNTPFFSSRIPSRIPVTLSYHVSLGFFCLWLFPKLFSLFTTLTVWRVLIRHFIGFLSIGICLIFFSHGYTGIMCLDGEIIEIKYDCHHIISKVDTIHIVMTVDINLDHLAKVAFIMFLQFKVILCPLPYSMHSPPLRIEEYILLI